MRRLKIVNPAVDRTYVTYLSTDYSSGVTAAVQNTTSFQTGDLALVGEPTEELTEVKKLNGVPDIITLTLASALNFNHEKGTVIYKVPWDQVEISRAPANGNFSIISTSAIQWDSKTNETYYYDNSGDDTYSYRFRFYNSSLVIFSEYSPTITGASPDRDSVRYMISNIRAVADDRERKVITDVEIIRQLNRAQDIVYAHNTKYWFLKVDPWAQRLRTGIENGIATVAHQAIYSLSAFSDLAHVDIIKYRYNPSDANSINVVYILRREIEPQFSRMVRDLNRADVDIQTIWKLIPSDSSSAQGYFEVNPVPKTSDAGYFYPTYFKKITDLVSVTDSTIIPLPSILEDFVIGYIFALKGDETKAAQYRKMFYGPPGATKDKQDLTGMQLLDEWDKAQQQGSGQPKSLWKYLGQKPEKRFYGEYTIMSPDYKRETYF